MLKLPIAISALALAALIAGGAVASAASAPVAANDSITVYAATTTFIDVLTNDTPSTGATFGSPVSIVTQPAHGWAATDPLTNKVSYIAPSDWAGTDSFTYQVTDSSGATATGTITVTVAGFDPVMIAEVQAELNAALAIS